MRIRVDQLGVFHQCLRRVSVAIKQLRAVVQQHRSVQHLPVLGQVLAEALKIGRDELEGLFRFAEVHLDEGKRVLVERQVERTLGRVG